MAERGSLMMRVRPEAAGSSGRELSDRLLLAAIRRGDLEALGALYDRYAPFVYTLASAAPQDVAERITEDVFLDIWRSELGVVAEGRLVSQLAAMVCQKLERLSRARQPREPVLPALAPFADLPPQICDLVILCLLAQMDAREIAVALELEVRVVASSLLTGFELLRRSPTPRIATLQV